MMATVLLLATAAFLAACDRGIAGRAPAAEPEASRLRVAWPADAALLRPLLFAQGRVEAAVCAPKEGILLAWATLLAHEKRAYTRDKRTKPTLSRKTSYGDVARFAA